MALKVIFRFSFLNGLRTMRSIGSTLFSREGEKAFTIFRLWGQMLMAHP